MNKGIIERIVNWNKERLLDKQPFNYETEILNILEELLETTGIKSDEARRKAKGIFYLFFNNNNPEEEDIVDALADIIVYSAGAMLKLGYSPFCVMDEVLKEIESRIGKIVDGKFVKDKSPEAMSKWYKADFNKCKLNKGGSDNE